LVIKGEGALRKEECDAFAKFHQRFRALLKRGHQVEKLLPKSSVCLPALQPRHEGDCLVGQALIVRFADVVAVQILKFREVKTRRRAADAFEVEPLDCLFRGENLVVAMTPAEAHEIVPHRLRQIAEIAVSFRAKRAMTLGELGAIRTMNERYMRKFRDIPAESRINLALAARIGQ